MAAHQEEGEGVEPGAQKSLWVLEAQAGLRLNPKTGEGDLSEMRDSKLGGVHRCRSFLMEKGTGSLTEPPHLGNSKEKVCSRIYQSPNKRGPNALAAWLWTRRLLRALVSACVTET